MSKPTKLPEGWKLVSLGEVGTLINGDRGKNYPSQKDFVDNGVPFINAGHIQNGEIDFESMNFISRKRFDLLGSGKVKSGDILYCLRGSLGKTAIIKDIQEGAIASSLVIIRPSEQIRTDYFYRYLASPIGQAEIYKYDNGSSQPNLSAQSLKQYQLPLPPLEEQRKIAAILDKADGVRRKRKEAIRLTEELLKSTFLEMFGDPVTNPKGWETHKLKEFTKRPITYGILKPGPHVSEGIPMLRIQDIHNGRVTASGIHKVSPELSSEYSRTVLRGGEIVISLVGTLGLTALIPESLKGANVHRNLGVIDIESEIVLSSFIFHYFKFSGIENFLLKNTKGGVQSLLNLGELREMPVNLPPLSLQQDFESLASNQIALNTNALSAYEQSENLFNSLLQRAFRGEL